MISVCLASYNGEDYIVQQIDSILKQLSVDDELIVSDDGSIDSTVTLLRNISDPRIKICFNKQRPAYVSHNFEYTTSNFNNALRSCKGDYIFLSDQDDIWLPNKVKLLRDALDSYDLVLSNCLYMNGAGVIAEHTKFTNLPPKKSVFANLVSNSFQGSTMAFNRRILELSLPIPVNTPHDMWLGFIALWSGKVFFCEHPTMIYRRHSNTVTAQHGEKNYTSLFFKIKYRIVFVCLLSVRLFKLRLSTI